MTNILINKKIKVRTDFISTFIIIMFYLSGLFHFISGNILFQLAQFFLGMSSILILSKSDNVSKGHIYFLYIINLSLLLSISINKNIMPLGAVMFISYSLLSLLLVNFKLDFSLTSLSFIIHCIVFIYYIISGQNPNEIFVESSRNYISVVMIIQTILIYISSYQNKKSVSIIPALINLFISIWGIGRSGIFSALLIVVAIILYKIQNSNKSIKVKRVLFGIPFLIILAYLLIPFFIRYLLPAVNESFDIFQVKVETNVIGGDPRFIMIEQYINYTFNSVAGLLFGVNYSNIPILRYFNYNPHNSIIRLHSIYGLVGILIYLKCFLKSFHRYIKNRNFLYLLFMFSILFRSFTDIIAFPGLLDPIFIYFIFSNPYSHQIKEK